jgi:hypothetical protein
VLPEITKNTAIRAEMHPIKEDPIFGDFRLRNIRRSLFDTTQLPNMSRSVLDPDEYANAAVKVEDQNSVGELDDVEKARQFFDPNKTQSSKKVQNDPDKIQLQR